MSDSTQFMQEMTNKDQERSSWTKVCSLKRADGRLSVQAPVSSQPVRFQECFQDAHGNQLFA